MSVSKPTGSQETTVIATSPPVLSPFLVSCFSPVCALCDSWLFQATLDFFPGVTAIMRRSFSFPKQKLSDSISHTEMTIVRDYFKSCLCDYTYFFMGYNIHLTSAEQFVQPRNHGSLGILAISCVYQQCHMPEI